MDSETNLERLDSVSQFSFRCCPGGKRVNCQTLCEMFLKAKCMTRRFKVLLERLQLNALVSHKDIPLPGCLAKK